MFSDIFEFFDLFFFDFLNLSYNRVIIIIWFLVLGLLGFLFFAVWVFIIIGGWFFRLRLIFLFILRLENSSDFIIEQFLDGGLVRHDLVFEFSSFLLFKQIKGKVNYDSGGKYSIKENLDNHKGCYPFSKVNFRRCVSILCSG